MVKYLLFIGILSMVLLNILLIRNIKNKKIKYAILILPFILAGLVYIGIRLMANAVSPDVCDAFSIVGMFIVFMSLGIGITLNLINIFHLIFIKDRQKLIE